MHLSPLLQILGPLNGLFCTYILTCWLISVSAELKCTMCGFETGVREVFENHMSLHASLHGETTEVNGKAVVSQPPSHPQDPPSSTDIRWVTYFNSRLENWLGDWEHLEPMMQQLSFFSVVLMITQCAPFLSQTMSPNICVVGSKLFWCYWEQKSLIYALFLSSNGKCRNSYFILYVFLEIIYNLLLHSGKFRL